MNRIYYEVDRADTDCAAAGQRYKGVRLELSFSQQPNREAPVMIKEILRNAYLKRITSESGKLQ